MKTGRFQSGFTRRAYLKAGLFSGRLKGMRENGTGVGLGLALVRQIARHHGGDVRCSSRDGGGSCFEVTLKRAAAR